MKAKRKQYLSLSLLVVFGILLNYLNSLGVTSLGWPLYLDSIGTILVAATGGMLPGIIVGFVTNALTSIADPVSMYYALVSILIAVVVSTVARKGAFRDLKKAPLIVLYTALLGGGLGSVITWFLYGFSFGSGVSAPLAQWIFSHVKVSTFIAQFSADLLIDLLDKTISVGVVYLILFLVPQKILKVFPLGYLYDKTTKLADILKAAKERRDMAIRRLSLKYKVILLIMIAFLSLSFASLFIGIYSIRSSLYERYSEEANAVTELMVPVIDASKVNEYLETKTTDAAYDEVVTELEAIRSAFSSIKFMYVYQIREDGCHVVFDLDAVGVPGSALGDVIDFDAAFSSYKSELLAGQTLDKAIITNDEYGYLLSRYTPVYDAAGTCVCYACADVDMNAIVNERVVYAIRMISILFAVAIVIMVVTISLAESQLVEPINRISKATAQFAVESDEGRMESLKAIEALDIRTGDEIETAYRAICRTFGDITHYIVQVQENARTIDRMQTNIIESFASMVESRDANTGDHIRRTAAYVEVLATGLEHSAYAEFITPEFIYKVRRSAPLHDIGKISIPDAILNKNGRLTDEEFAVMKTHVVTGRDILERSLSGIGDTSYLSEAINMATYHHERWDGKGYMAGLKGEEIPLSARIMSVADVFDALTSKRSYKEAFSFERSVAIMKEGSGTQFDPEIIKVFLANLPAIQAILTHEDAVPE